MGHRDSGIIRQDYSIAVFNRDYDLTKVKFHVFKLNIFLQKFTDILLESKGTRPKADLCIIIIQSLSILICLL